MVTPRLLRHDLLEDEGRWALLTGAVHLVAAVLLAGYDVDPESIPALALIALLAATGYLIRGIGRPFPAWSIPVTAGVAYVMAALIDSDAEGFAFFSLIALFYAFFREQQRRRLWWSIAATVPMPVLLVALGMIDSDGWLYWSMGCLICAGFGYVAFGLRLAVAEVEEQRRLATEQAVAAERRRIARDVHDLVGHSLAVTLLHVTAARRAVAENPAGSTASLTLAEEVGRNAMAEIRGTIRMLADTDTAAESAAEPVPGLDDLGPLVDQYRQAGLDIELTVDGDLAGIERARSLAGYRIVQEALVNAAKHARGSAVLVKAEATAARLMIRIVNHGLTSTAEPSTGGSDRGHGLIGMGERARSVGGTVTAGPTEDGWLVETLLPRAGAAEASNP